jgi:hypothetical protein
MYDTGLDRNQTCCNDLQICQSQSGCCKRCERTRKFEELLDRLTIASKASDYVERISATVATICAVYAQFYSCCIHN